MATEVHCCASCFPGLVCTKRKATDHSDQQSCCYCCCKESVGVIAFLCTMIGGARPSCPKGPNSDWQMILVVEMMVLIAGEAGLAVMHGWSDDLYFNLQPYQTYYTPIYAPLRYDVHFIRLACAAQMVLLFLLIASLAAIFLGLSSSQTLLLRQHVIALYACWPISMIFTVGALASGVPFLVGFAVFTFFCLLIPFGCYYSHVADKLRDAS